MITESGPQHLGVGVAALALDGSDMDETVTRFTLVLLGECHDADGQHPRCRGRLRRAGRSSRAQAQGEDFAVLEREQEVGGVWRDNTYPGCACDIPSHLYSLSFAPNPHWTHAFSGQPEIRDYLRRVAREHGLLPHIRFGCSLLEAAWDDAAQRWRIETSAGPLTAGRAHRRQRPHRRPVGPGPAGPGRFTGEVFHSARWNHDVDLAGRNVVVVGTGASAIQFVPAIQPRAGRMTVVQRTRAMDHPADGPDNDPVRAAALRGRAVAAAAGAPAAVSAA